LTLFYDRAVSFLFHALCRDGKRSSAAHRPVRTRATEV
jgi:hypothetical protein